jgi:predicted extracellular nuclease
MNVSSLRQFLFAGAALSAAAFAPLASAEIYITEWMYNGNGKTGEYIEFTNLGDTAVDFSGWSFDDDSNNPGSVSLSAFGLVNPGESVILTEATAADFRSVWNLSGSVKVIGNNTNNLGRNDQINLYDNLGQLVDRPVHCRQGKDPAAGECRDVELRRGHVGHGQCDFAVRPGEPRPVRSVGRAGAVDRAGSFLGRLRQSADL